MNAWMHLEVSIRAYFRMVGRGLRKKRSLSDDMGKFGSTSCQN